MKKITVKKLQLKKGVVAQLNKGSMNQVAGGGDHTVPCPTVVDTICQYFNVPNPTHPCHSVALNVCVAVGQVPTFHYECSNTCP